MNVFISQPMSDKSDEEIEYIRGLVIDKIKNGKFFYGEDNYNIEVVNKFYRNVPRNENALFYLGEAIKSMAYADLVYFCKGWENYRGCIIEHECARRYNKQRIYE